MRRLGADQQRRPSQRDTCRTRSVGFRRQFPLRALLQGREIQNQAKALEDVNAGQHLAEAMRATSTAQVW
jgi:hypothetical protein